MSIEDWIDLYGEPDDSQEEDVECYKCGRAGLHWEQSEGVWLLCTPTGKVHQCGKVNPLREFTDLDQ